MSIKKRIFIGLLVIGVGLGAAYWWYTLEKNDEAETKLVLYGNGDKREDRLSFNGNEQVQEL